MPLPAALAPAAKLAPVSHPAPTQGWILGLDGGGTKTLGLSLEAGTFQRREARGGPTNINVTGLDTATSTLHELLGALRPNDTAPLACVFGVAGILEAAELAAMTGVLTQELGIPADKVFLLNDTVNAWAAGCGGHAGIVGIMGTGTNVIAVNDDGDSWRAGGWGEVLGDEASGWWFGREAVRWVLGHRDGSRSEPPFLKALCDEAIPGREIEALARYAMAIGKTGVAALAKYVLHEAQAGHAEAMSILDTGVSSFADCILACDRQLQLHDEERRLAVVGGIAENFAIVRERLEHALSVRGIDLTVQLPQMEPVEGALLLAARAAGMDESHLG